ncbi:MAG: C39 family peptidase [Candidatus Dormibacteraeota bacterium]|nr:C39 family peptidase [Candidatus Dormibacteraeota bacterium]
MRIRVALATAVTALLIATALIVGVRLHAAGSSSPPRAVAHRQKSGPAATPAPTPTPSPAPTPTPSPVPTPAPPGSHQLTVPYTEQAVNGIWNADNEHWCTAAATVMLEHYYTGDTQAVIPAATANAQMAQVIAQDRATYPGVIELPLPDVEHTAAAVYGMVGTIEPMSFTAMEQSIAAGHPVILAVMTHGLPGGQAIAPYYSSGNTHHVILITGYNAADQTVVTNDPGFYQGRSYVYSWSTLQVASAQEGAIYDRAGTMLILTPG